MRCFIAIDIESNKINEIINELRRYGGIKVVEPENIHITLKFLGEINNRTAEKICNIMHKLFNEEKKFEIHIGNLGVFPNERYIRVLWIGIKKNKERIVDLQKTLDNELSKLGFKKENKYEPHITIARIKSPAGRKVAQDFLYKLKNVDIGSYIIDEIKLKKSTLTREGPIYTDLYAVKLKD